MNATQGLDAFAHCATLAARAVELDASTAPVGPERSGRLTACFSDVNLHHTILGAIQHNARGSRTPMLNWTPGLLSATILATALCAFGAGQADAQIRSPAWLEVHYTEDSAVYIDVNSINRSESTATVFTLRFTNGLPEIDGKRPYFMVTRESYNCTDGTSQSDSTALYDADGVGVYSFQESFPERTVVMPGTVSARLHNVACFPNSEEVTATQAQLAMEMAESRGLDRSGRPVYEEGTIVVFGRQLAITTDTGYEPIEPAFEVPVRPGAPTNLWTQEPAADRLIRFDGTYWIIDANNQRLSTAPQFPDGSIGIIPETDQTFAFYRGWRPRVARTYSVFENGDTRYIGDEVATFWNGRLWFGIIYDSTADALAARVAEYPPPRQSQPRRRR